MKRILFVAIFAAMLFMIGINLIKKPEVKPSPSVDALVKSVIKKNSGQEAAPALNDRVQNSVTINMEKAPPESGKVIRSDDGKMVVQGVLPPELTELNANLSKTNKLIEDSLALNIEKTESEAIKQLIQDTDALISETNEKLGIETPTEAKQ